MSFTKVAPAGIGTSPGTSIRIGDSLLHSTGIDIGTGSGIGVTIRQHGNATFTGIVTAASFSGSGANLTGIDATSIKHTDGNVKVQAINTGANLTGNLAVSGNATVTGTLGVGGVVTYEDVTNVDSVGVITARSGIKIGPTAGVAATIFADGSINSTGIVTATTFVGALTGNATGLSGTPNISAGTIAGSTGTFTGDVDIADKIVHTGDTNTAIRFPAADTITAETGGSERLHIDSAGNMSLGKGSASSTGYGRNFQIHHDGTSGSSLHLTDNNTGSGNGDGFHIISTSQIAYLWQRENANMVFGTNGSARWNIYGSNGHLAPNADSTYDIGTSSVRVRNGYFDTVYGDGSNLTGITGTTINNNANNRLITGSGTANTLEGESNFTYDGTIGAINGNTAGLAVGTNAMVSGRPDNTLHLHRASSGTADGPTIWFTNQQTGVSGSDGFTVGLNDTQSPYLWNRENTDLRFGTNNNHRMTLDNDGNLRLLATNNQLSATHYQCTATISSNYTVTTTYNEMMIGPITINNGVTLAVNTGARLVVL